MSPTSETIVSKMKESPKGNNNNNKAFEVNDGCITRCHEMSDSLFSSKSGFTNFGGIMNWFIILLVLVTGGSAVENIMEYGILIDPVMWLSMFLKDPSSWPLFLLLIALNFFILTAFGLQLCLSQELFSEKLVVFLNAVNLFLEITFPAGFVLCAHPNPLTSSVMLVIYVAVFLKLISYIQVNSWCRDHLNSSQRKIQKQTTAYSISTGSGQKVDGAIQVYPDNLYLKDLYYFICAPTLCYDLNFPRSAQIRIKFLLKRGAEMVLLWGLMLGLIQQWIIPTINNSLIPFQEQIFSQMIERLLTLAVPHHLIWLIFFYWMFHSCLNVVAELLRFGDRTFYKDWWNAETIQYFWQTWNIPVHKWASRHLYKPLIRAGISRFRACVIVFFVSAIFHEYLVSIPLHMFRLWSFMGLIAQVPLAMLTKNIGRHGNVIVWMSLIIGMPTTVLMYYHDYYVVHR